MKYEDLAPGAILPRPEPVEINAGIAGTTIPITNTGKVPVHLTAYFHVFEANPRLSFDRRKAFGMRPDVLVGGAVRLEPGETKAVALVPFTGRRIVRGFNGFVDGPLNDVDLDSVLHQMIERGFLHQPAGEGE